MLFALLGPSLLALYTNIKSVTRIANVPILYHPWVKSKAKIKTLYCWMILHFLWLVARTSRLTIFLILVSMSRTSLNCISDCKRARVISLRHSLRTFLSIMVALVICWRAHDMVVEEQRRRGKKQIFKFRLWWLIMFTLTRYDNVFFYNKIFLGILKKKW